MTTEPAQTDPPIRVHLVGNAHIDPAWLWSYAEGRAEVLATYRAAVELLKEEPALIFTAGGSVTYQWVAQDDPKLLNQIRQLVQERRWCLVNGWWVQPDCNLPATESFVRHALYGQRTLEQLLGRRATIGYNVDSFGHNAALPGLLLSAGLTAYVFSRPGSHEKADLPADYFWWEGIDGSRVLAARLTAHYQATPESLADRIRLSVEAAHPDIPQVLCFFGVGNHGGGPTRADMAAIQQVRTKASNLRLEFSSPERFFDAIRPYSAALPVYAGELQHHARGCYTAVAEVKYLNRQAECALITAETACAWTASAVSAPYPNLAEAWQVTLLHQFHDTLGGTCLPEVYEDEVFPDLRTVIRRAKTATRGALTILGERVALPASADGYWLLVFNPLSFARRDAIHAAIPAGRWQSDFEGRFRPGQVIVEDQAGLPIAAQVTALDHIGGTYRVHFTFVADLPAVGYRVFRVKVPADADSFMPVERPLDGPLENEWLSAAIDPNTGWISKLILRQPGINLCSGPIGIPEVLDDPGDTWAHDVHSFDEVTGYFEAEGNVAVVEDGPVRRVVQIHSHWGESTLTLYMALYHQLARLDCRYEVDWHEHHKMLKLVYPLSCSSGRAWAEIPGGALYRATDGSEQPCLRWVDLSGQSVDGHPAGLSIVNDRLHGYDARPGEIRLSLLRSPIYAFHQPRQRYPGVHYRYTDQGTHVFQVTLVPHVGNLSCASVTQQALMLNYPCEGILIPPFQTDAQPARQLLPTSPPLASWAEIAPASVLIEAIKLAEDGSGDVILRAREADGQTSHAKLRLDTWRWEADFGPFQIRTWRMSHLAPGQPPVETNLLEEPVQM